MGHAAGLVLRFAVATVFVTAAQEEIAGAARRGSSRGTYAVALLAFLFHVAAAVGVLLPSPAPVVVWLWLVVLTVGGALRIRRRGTCGCTGVVPEARSVKGLVLRNAVIGLVAVAGMWASPEPSRPITLGASVVLTGLAWVVFLGHVSQMRPMAAGVAAEFLAVVGRRRVR